MRAAPGMAKKSLSGLRCPTSVATKRRPTKVLRKLATPFARDAIEGLAAGLDVFGFTKGQFSFVDLIDAVLDLTGSLSRRREDLARISHT